MNERDHSITGTLLRWYAANKRPLPFRETGDPYHIWISEIMAQQTRITTLVPYYLRFIERFPSIASLAAAPQDEVLKVWEGLGYYARARNLQAAAQQMMQQHDGRMPHSYDALLALPGIGAYTAGAILSIAYDYPWPAVDGNVLRVIARLDALRNDIGRVSTRRRVGERVLALMPKNRASDFTQALMELGALVCLPGEPRCPGCPLAQNCLAHMQGTEQELPIRMPRAKQRVQLRSIYMLQNEAGDFLLHRRNERLLFGLWEFPGHDDHATDALRYSLLDAGLCVPPITPIMRAHHTFTHIKWDMQGYHAQLSSTPTPADGYVWAPVNQLGEYAIPTAFSAFVAWARIQGA